ncbi:PREDICTED: uncharacterized protein LOC105314214 isoform X1 [Amphimedon queenslandica]|uniref:AIG1-type G domain-containing protein n=1 Tax=Amphimedon queenslandica TaxID=400682 RepID=A0AAN0IPJ5_AMPQE|nr:PREDICTED: uncharacterized protein LOC105314214 isoform X1 [Amphimedon queenslandica]|eukprot:XP_011406553.1 PREDICTED: uncharacterized protein LOC105314214 isoform X1 [Amphimedon queenslandica]
MATGHGRRLYKVAGKIGTHIGSLLKRAWDKDSDGSRGLRLLVTGKTGERKSTLVNGLLGATVAKEGASAGRCTATVQDYRADLEGVPVTVFDSPAGSQDTTGNENDYIADMKKKCQALSLVHCTKMTNNHLKDEDRHAFGHKFWKYVLLVLPFANKEDLKKSNERDEDEGPKPDDDEESGKAPMPEKIRRYGAQIASLIKSAWDKDLEGSQGLRLLVTGKTGEGKSALINGLLGAKVAVEGADSERCTAKVQEYKAELEGVPVTVFDSPGLQDGTEMENEYLEDMKKKCKTLNLVLYCTRMTNNRLKEEDKHAILKLTAAFGQNFWKHTVLVLTFANREDVERSDERDEDEGPEPDYADEESWKELGKKRFKGRLKKWEESFHKFLIDVVGVHEDIVERILVVPAGDHRVTRKNKEPYRLPDRDDWFKELWLASILRVKGMKLFLQINKSRIVAEDEVETGTEVTADEESELPEEEPPDVQDSTLQLTDAPAVDETYTAKLQENIKKMDKEAWVKGQEAQLKEKEEEIRKQREEVERQLANKKVILTNSDIEKIILESLKRAFGETFAAEALVAKVAWKSVTKLFKWFKSLF